MPQLHNVRIGSSLYSVEVADTPHLQQLGLSFRTHLSSNRGVLFAFPDEVNRIFHMRNMKFPLDIIFIGADKRVKWIIENAQPDNERLISLRPSKYVLEVNAGDVKKNGIRMHSKLDTLNNPLIKSSDTVEPWLQKQDGGEGGFSGTAHTSEGTNTFTRTFGPSKNNKKPWTGKKKKNWAKILTSAPDEEHITVAMLNEWLEKQDRDIPSEMRGRGLEPKTGDWEHPYRWVRSIDSSTLSPTEKIHSIIESAPDLKHVLGSLSEVGQPYLVGGCVRDILIGKDCKDFDIEMYGVPQDELGELIQSRFGGKAEQVGKQFGVFKVGDFDISLPRTETQTGEKHTDFDVVPDHTLDPMTAARRRDFTINAMMYDVKEGKILDFFGGEEDLSNGLIKHIDDETFVEDPLRVYRAAQFAARFGFDIDPATKELASQMDLSHLPRERVNEEFTKMLLKSDNPSIGLDALAEMGVLKRYFPEISILDETPQRDDYHAEGDVFTHTKMVLDRAADVIKRFPSDKEKITIMLASLCHDLGKPSTTEHHPDGSVSQHGHEEAGVDPTREFLSKVTRDTAVLEDVEFLVEHHLLPPNYFRSNTSDSTFRKLINRYGMRRLKLLAAVSEADILGRLNRAEDGGTEEPDNEATEWFNMRLDEVAEKSNLTSEGTIKPLITGHDLKDLGFVEGRELGDILRDIQSQQEIGEIADSSEALEYVKDTYMSKSLGDLVGWLFKAVSTESVAEAKRKGLVPQSGDWQKPKRWVRPEDADVVVEEPDAPRVYSYDEVKKLVEDKFSLNFDFDETQKKHGVLGEKDSGNYYLSYDQIEDIKEVIIGTLDGEEDGPTPKHVYEGFGKPTAGSLAFFGGPSSTTSKSRGGKRTIPKWQLDRLDGNIILEWDESPDDEALERKTGTENIHVAAHCDVDFNIVFWRTRNRVTYKQEYPAKRHQETAETMVHELGHTLVSSMRDVPTWITAYLHNAYSKAVKSEKGFVSEYSTTDEYEFFAECYRTYIAKTDLLEKTNPEMFELMEILNQAESMESLERPLTEEDFDKYDLQNIFTLSNDQFIGGKQIFKSSVWRSAYSHLELYMGGGEVPYTQGKEGEELEKIHRQIVKTMSLAIRNYIGIGYSKEDLMKTLDAEVESQERVDEQMRNWLAKPDEQIPESVREMAEDWEFKTYDELHPNVRPLLEELIDSTISKHYPDYGKVEPWISMYGRKDVDIKKQASNVSIPMENEPLGKIIDPVEVGYPIDEESIREATKFIREKKAKQLSDDESLEKAVSTEAVASAKGRGLVPKTGNWQKPGRWVRPEDADVPVDEDEASLATQNVYTEYDIRQKIRPTIKVSGFPGIGRGRPKIGQSSQGHKNDALDILSKATGIFFKALDGLGKPNPFEKGERTLPKWQIDKFGGITFNWDVVDAEAVDGITGEVLGSVHVGTQQMLLNGLKKRFPRSMGGFDEVINPETGKTEIKKIPASVIVKEHEDDFMNTIIHELGHCIATEVTDDIPYWFWSRVESQYSHAQDSPTFFPSNYSKRNVAEFFAECFKTYMTNTELLRDINPEMFELMETLNSTSPDNMEVRPLNEEEVKGDLNLRQRSYFVATGFQTYVRSEVYARAVRNVLEELEDDLSKHRENHPWHTTALESGTVRYFLREIKKEKKELEKWETEALTYKRITMGNIRKAIASGYVKEDILKAVVKSKKLKGYMEPSSDHMEEVNFWVDEEIKKYPTYGEEYPWTSISPSIQFGDKINIDKQDDSLTEEDFETYVEIYETPTVISDGEEIADSITEESVREMDEPLEKATDSKLNRRTEFTIEDTEYEPLAGTWKKVFVGGEPKWINQRGEYKDFSDFEGVSITKQESQKEPHSTELEKSHCLECGVDCACVTDLSCACSHDCICPDIVALGQADDNLVSSMVIHKQVTAESVADARSKGLIPQSGNWMKPSRWVRPVSDVPEKTKEPVTEKSVPPNRQNVELHDELTSFAEERGLNYSLESDYVSVDISRAKTIADAYEAMEHAPNDPEVKASYNAMANETKSQWDYLESVGYVMEPWSGDGQPYTDSKEMVNDIIDNKHIYFFPTKGGFGSSDDIEEDHPLLQDSGVEVNDTPLVFNDLFRAVHDVIGHSRGNQFGARGEENAWMEHRQLYSTLARKAMTTETRGQNSWVNFGPHLRSDSGNMLKPGDENYISPRDRQFADQKAGLLPEEFLQKMLLKLLKKQVSVSHCSQCSSGCDCVLEDHTCECFHDCTCPDNSLSNGAVDIVIDVDSLTSFLNLQKAVVSTPMSGEGKFNAKGVETGDSVWITVNDPESPLRGRHILITKRPDGLFALTGGGGQSKDVAARKHIILTGTPKESKRDKELKQEIEEAEGVNSEVIAEKRGIEQEARETLKEASNAMTEALGIKKADPKELLDKKDEVQRYVESVVGEESSPEAKRITDVIMRHVALSNRTIQQSVQAKSQSVLTKVGRKLREVKEAEEKGEDVDTTVIPDTIIAQGTTIEDVVESEAVNVDVLDEVNEALPKFDPISIPLPDIAGLAELTPAKQESAIANYFDDEVKKALEEKDDELAGVDEEDKITEKEDEEGIVTIDLGTAVAEPLVLKSQEQLEEAIEKTRDYFEKKKAIQLQAEQIKKVPLSVVTPSTLSDLKDSIAAIDVSIDDDELEQLTKDNFDRLTSNNQTLAFYDAVGEFWNDNVALTEEISGAGGSKVESTMKFHMDSGAATALAVLAKEHLGLKIDTRKLMEKGNIELAASSVAWAIRDKYKGDAAKLDEIIDSIRTDNATNLGETEERALERHSNLSKQMGEIQKQKESGELLDKVKIGELERNNLIEQRINLGVSLGSMQASATLFDQLVKVRTAKDNVLTLNAGEHRRDAETVVANLRLKEGSYDIQPTEEGTWNVILSSDGLEKHTTQEKDLQSKHDKYDKIKTDDTGLSEDDDGNVIVEDFDVPFWNDKFVPEGEEDTSQTIDYKWRAEQRNDINWLLATTEKSADNPTGQGGGLITRTVGAGKTNTALGFFAHKMQENPDYKSIVAVPKGRAQQWYDEANRFMSLPEGMSIQLIPEGASKSDVDDILLNSAKGTLFITGHRELSRSHEMLGQIQTNAELGEKIGKFGGICIDEPQELQARGQSGNMGALGRRLMKLPIDHRVGLTATPARRSPLEVYDLIKWSSGATDIGAKTTFQRTFGGFGSGTNAQDTAIRKVFYETIAPYISGDRITQPTFKVNSDTIDITRTDSQIARQKEIESTREKTISDKQRELIAEAEANPNHKLNRGSGSVSAKAKKEARKEVESQHQENMDGGDWQNNGRLVALREQLEGASDKKHVVYIDSATQRNALSAMLKDMGYTQNQIKNIASTTTGISGTVMAQRVKDFRKGDIPFIMIDSKSSSGYNLQTGDQLHVIGTPPEAANYVQAQGRIARMPRKGDVDIKTYRYADSPTEQAHWNDLDAQIKLLRATAPGLFRGQYEEEL